MACLKKVHQQASIHTHLHAYWIIFTTTLFSTAPHKKMVRRCTQWSVTAGVISCSPHLHIILRIRSVWPCLFSSLRSWSHVMAHTQWWALACLRTVYHKPFIHPFIVSGTGKTFPWHVAALSPLHSNPKLIIWCVVCSITLNCKKLKRCHMTTAFDRRNNVTEDRKYDERPLLIKHSEVKQQRVWTRLLMTSSKMLYESGALRPQRDSLQQVAWCVNDLHRCENNIVNMNSGNVWSDTRTVCQRDVGARSEACMSQVDDMEGRQSSQRDITPLIIIINTVCWCKHT